MGRKKVANLSRQVLVKSIEEKKLVEATNPASNADSATDKINLPLDSHITAPSVDDDNSLLTEAMGKLSLVQSKRLPEKKKKSKKAMVAPSPAIHDNSEPLEQSQRARVVSSLALQEIFLRIPSYAHPTVTEYIKSKIMTILEFPEVTNDEFIKFTSSISRTEIDNVIAEAALRLDMSLDVFLMPPVFKCNMV